VISRHASRYQRGGQKPDIEEQTIQWPREKREKGQTMIYKTLHRKLKIEQYGPHQKPRVPLNGKPFLLPMWHPSCYS